MASTIFAENFGKADDRGITVRPPPFEEWRDGISVKDKVPYEYGPSKHRNAACQRQEGQAQSLPPNRRDQSDKHDYTAREQGRELASYGEGGTTKGENRGQWIEHLEALDENDQRHS
jgi:hypothetical protein